MHGPNFSEKKSQCIMLDILVEPLPYEIDISVSIFQVSFGPGAYPMAEIFASNIYF